MKFLTKWIGRIVVVGAIIIGAAVGKVIVNNWGYSDPREAVAKIAVDAVRSNGLPRKMDDWTTLIAVDQVKTTVAYSFRIERDLSDADKSTLSNKLKQTVTRRVCNSPMKEGFIDKSVGIRYTYYDINLNYVGAFFIDCDAGNGS